jgi:hypothetical protein
MKQMQRLLGNDLRGSDSYAWVMYICIDTYFVQRVD